MTDRRARARLNTRWETGINVTNQHHRILAVTGASQTVGYALGSVFLVSGTADLTLHSNQWKILAVPGVRGTSPVYNETLALHGW